MHSIKRILVAIKDSAQHPDALAAKLISLASALGAEVELFHAIPASPHTQQAQNEIQASCESGLSQLALALRDAEVRASVRAVWDSPPCEAIIRRATEIGADLIITQQHTSGHGFAPRLRHLTDWALMRLSPLPVLLMKNLQPYRQPIVLAAVDPQQQYEKPDTLDQLILEAGQTFAKALNGALHAVHACQSLIAERDLDEEARIAHIPPARRHFIDGDVCSAIVKTARDTGSALVVLGSVSRTGLKWLLIGNTAESLLDALDCDVLVLKPPQESMLPTQALAQE